MRYRFSIILLTLIITFTMIVPSYGLSAPRYPPQEYPEIIPGLIAVYGDRLVVYDYGSRSIQILDTGRWESRIIRVGGEPNDIVILGGWLVIGLDYGLEIIDLGSGSCLLYTSPSPRD